MKKKENEIMEKEVKNEITTPIEKKNLFNLLQTATGVLYKSVRGFTDKLYLKMIIEK